MKCHKLTGDLSYSELPKPQPAPLQPRALVEEREINMMRAAGKCGLKREHLKAFQSGLLLPCPFYVICVFCRVPTMVNEGGTGKNAGREGERQQKAELCEWSLLVKRYPNLSPFFQPLSLVPGAAAPQQSLSSPWCEIDTAKAST